MGWNSDGKRLASGSFDKTVAVYLLDKDRIVSLTILLFPFYFTIIKQHILDIFQLVFY